MDKDNGRHGGSYGSRGVFMTRRGRDRMEELDEKMGRGTKGPETRTETCGVGNVVGTRTQRPVINGGRDLSFEVGSLLLHIGLRFLRLNGRA